MSDANSGVFARFIDVDRSICVMFGNSYAVAELTAAVATVNQRVKEELRRLREVV